MSKGHVMFDGTLPIVMQYMRDLPHDESGCQIWPLGAATNNGYGRFNIRVDGKQRGVLAHRASLADYLGRPLRDDERVLHSCDTPRCVNPAHLRVGTHAENMRDMALKGRGRSGAQPRFTRDDAVVMFDLRNSGLLLREIALVFDCERHTVTKTIRRYGVDTGSET